MENNPKTQAKFFVQYLGQNVVIDNTEKISSPMKMLGVMDERNIQIEYHPGLTTYCIANETVSLLLTPLSQITDEDAIKVAEIIGMSEDKLFIGKVLCTSSFDNSDAMAETSLYNMHCKAVDYIRSKGYAVDWNGLTVEKQIEYGWVRLKTKA